MRTTVLTAALALALATQARPDEGMWLFNAPPAKALDKTHGFAPDAKWLEHLQKSSVRFGAGGSASFVSADGLVMTNHHVGRGAIAKLSTREKDYQRDGFLAATRDAELKCPALELVVLQSIEDVTAKVNAAVKAGTAAEQAAARRAVIA